ncbi:hypothetical protein AX15_006710 [Amanita polypyramis BW_CC]|nr:hypothetical protein AX15_006710 [Amanita polypyramis BW_CC]
MATKLTLTCWTTGKDPNTRFIVQVDHDGLVDDLQEVIKKKENLAAGHLKLWKVSMPVDDMYGEDFKQHVNDVVRHGQLLTADTELSKIFVESPLSEHVHIIILDQWPTLLCWFFGENPNNRITVKVDINGYVQDLKQVIKSAVDPMLKDVPPYKLLLWDVSIPLDGQYGENINQLANDIERRGSPLSNDAKLSRIFVEPPPKDHVHIVVMDPRLTLVCRLAQDVMERLVSVKIDANKHVSHLGQAIRLAVQPKLEVVPLQELKLWQVSIPVHDKDSIRKRSEEIGKEEPLSFEKTTIGYFSKFRGYTKETLEYLKRYRSINPRKAAHVDWDDELDEDIAIYDGQSLTAQFPIPVTLLHPILAQFAEDCKTLEPTSEDNHLAGALMTAMSDSFVDGEEHFNILLNYLENYGNMKLDTDIIGDLKSGAHLAVDKTKVYFTVERRDGPISPKRSSAATQDTRAY